ncbi:MAG: hypothetical protein M1427_02430 [Candidatus Thermoplasmatota archaeon]|jgi:uncharacterized protein with ACT and thioredoxin-like domain|uniref:TPR repeats containing protein n=1 Tax=Cuniculiplasma divulgatum TaxID=1673428 RepID=A0A1R4A8C4_9ARCH|nr:hypothetical protein [Cuniculiplasma divulgatum]EQB69498.1 MAG: hypothetical protein AMDU5_GPLC00003G0048 [Thermoplasmatales archaeon Gpl]MCI2413108.1 hypothetical protein [Cuniculiplasma sp.]MCL4320086.1 hypothetical protein [Candidatus Thermoplasmatota archaeon]SJK85215.1 hypothetical protein CPM_1417 [Cuniculiplasma divulgatum]
MGFLSLRRNRTKSAVVNLESENDRIEPYMVKVLEKDHEKRTMNYEKNSSLAYEYVSSSLILAEVYAKIGKMDDARKLLDSSKNEIDKIESVEKRNTMETLYGKVEKRIH